MDFTHLVPSLLAVVPARLKSNADYQCLMKRNTSITVEICLFALIFFKTVDERLENPTVNKSFQIW